MKILVVVTILALVAIGAFLWHNFFDTKTPLFKQSRFTWIPEHITFDIDTLKYGDDLIYRQNLNQNLESTWGLTRLRIPSTWEIENHNWDVCILVIHMTNGSTQYISPRNLGLLLSIQHKKEMWGHIPDEELQSAWDKYGIYEEANKEFAEPYNSTIEEWQHMRTEIEKFIEGQTD